MDTVTKRGPPPFPTVVLIGSDPSIKAFYVHYYQLIWHCKVHEIDNLGLIADAHQEVDLFNDIGRGSLYLINKISGQFVNVYDKFEKRFQGQYPIIIVLSSSKSEFAMVAKKSKTIIVHDCYQLTAPSIRPLIKNLLSYFHLNFEPAALNYLATITCDNPKVIVGELKKLSLLYGTVQTPLSVMDIQSNFQLDQSTQLDQAIQALLMRDVVRFDQALPVQSMENDQYLILRILMKCFQQLLDLHARVKQNNSLTASIPQVMPPLFYSQKKVFTQCFHQWSVTQCIAMLEALIQCEITTKTAQLTPQQLKRSLIMLIVDQPEFLYNPKNLSLH